MWECNQSISRKERVTVLHLIIALTCYRALLKSSFTFSVSALVTLNAKLLPLNGWNLTPMLAGGAAGICLSVPPSPKQKPTLSWYPIATSGHKSEQWPLSFPSLMCDLCFPGGQGDGLILRPVGNPTRSQGPSSNNYLTSGETAAEQRQLCSRGLTPTETYRKWKQKVSF